MIPRPTVRPTLVALAFALALAPVIGGCRGKSREQRQPDDTSGRRSDSGAASGPASTQPSSFTGTLRGRAAAIGGETTGWRVEGDGQTGGIDLDVSKVRDRAKQLDGQRVTVRGRMTTRTWPERGTTQVLVVDQIEAAPRQGAGAGGR